MPRTSKNPYFLECMLFHTATQQLEVSHKFSRAAIVGRCGYCTNGCQAISLITQHCKIIWSTNEMYNKIWHWAKHTACWSCSVKYCNSWLQNTWRILHSRLQVNEAQLRNARLFKISQKWVTYICRNNSQIVCNYFI